MGIRKGHQQRLTCCGFSSAQCAEYMKRGWGQGGSCACGVRNMIFILRNLSANNKNDLRQIMATGDVVLNVLRIIMQISHGQRICKRHSARQSTVCASPPLTPTSHPVCLSLCPCVLGACAHLFALAFVQIYECQPYYDQPLDFLARVWRCV